MTTPAPSWQDLYDLAKAELVLRRPDLQVLPGDISDMLMAAIAAVADRAVGFASERTRATFLDGARGADLTKLADDHWNIDRILAVKSIGSVSFTRSTTVTSGTIFAGTVVATERDSLGNEVQFTTNSDLFFNVGVAGPLSANITAVVAGKAGNVPSGKIIRIITNLFDTFTVTNSAATIGGAEEETDDQLRQRVRDFNTTLRRGTMAALEYGAKVVTTVKNATAVEGSTGLVTVYVTDADGNSNAGMVADVTAELENWRCAGSLVLVTGGALYTLNPIQITLAVRTGIDTAEIAADVKSAIVERINRLRIGETCSRSIIQQAALNVDLDNIIGCTVVLPAADVVPSANQIIRTATTYITVT